MQFINGIPFFMLLVLAALGALIFVGFSLYRRLILPIILLKETGQAHRKSVNRLEIIVWSMYLLVVIYYDLITSLPVTVIILALILVAFFDFWRNYFSGIVLKFGDKLHLGDSITVNGHSGKILEFGNRTLKIINTIGEEMLIPYRLINTEVKIGQKSAPKILYKTLVLEGVGIKQKIENAIYTNPWIIISRPFSIALEDQRATLNFYVLNQEYFEKAKGRLLRDLKPKEVDG